MIKFGGEFLHVQTKINDLNATIGRMNFENRFTEPGGGRSAARAAVAAGADQLHRHGPGAGHAVLLHPGRLPDHAAADVEPRRALRVRDAAAREGRTTSPTSILRPGTMVFARDGDTFDRALIHPDRNNFAPRLGFAYTPAPRWVVRGGYGVFYTHTVRQGREGMLGFNPPYLVDNLLQTSVTGAAAVASAAPFRLVNGYPSGLLDPNSLAPTVQRRAQDPEPAHAVHPAVQRRRSVRADAEPAARCRVCRQQGNGTARLPQPESARGHPERERIAIGGRAAVSGVRRHPVDGESRLLRLQLAADAPGEAVVRRADGDRQLHVGPGDHRCARSHLDQRRRRRRRHRHVPRAAGQLQPRRRARAGRVRHRAPLRRQLRLGAAVRPRTPIRQRLEPRRWTCCWAAGS